MTTEKLTPAQVTFKTDLAAARKAASAARTALDQAVEYCAPINPDLAAVLAAHDPSAYAGALAKTAVVGASIEGLRETAAAATAAEQALEAGACRRCNGTGEYNAPTPWVRQGKPYCFGCGGSGCSARTAVKA